METHRAAMGRAWHRRASARLGSLLVTSLVVSTLVGADPVSAQVLPPGTFVEELTVDSVSLTGTTTTTHLQAFSLYRIDVSGRYDYFATKDVADAECSTHRSERVTKPFGLPVDVQVSQPGWQRYRYAVYGLDFPVSMPFAALTTDLWDPDPSDDPLDLIVDGRNVEWIPAVPPSPDSGTVTQPPFGCSPSHDYFAYFVPPATRPVNFRVFDLYNADNFGSLTVRISFVDGPFLDEGTVGHQETVVLDSRNPVGATTTADLEAGTSHLLVAHGLFHYDILKGFDRGWLADAACSRTGPDPVYERDRWSELGENLLEVHAGGLPLPWRPILPTQPDPSRVAGVVTGEPPPSDPAELVPLCDRVFHYYWAVIEGQGAPVHLSIKELDVATFGDNRGSVFVEVFEVEADGGP